MKVTILQSLLGLLLLLTSLSFIQAQVPINNREDNNLKVLPDRPGEGVMVARGKNTNPIPLKQTDVKMSVFGFVASVDVEQTFINSFPEKIEAIYIFPLPTNAAVDDMEITIGKRKIRGEIKTREEARREYEQARDSGNRAALLEQERPNIFMTAIANIEPNSQIVVKIHYTERIAYDDGGFRFSFPMVVAPKYIPGDLQVRDGKLKRLPNPTPASPAIDVEKIVPPNLPAGIRPGNITLTLDLEAGFPIKKINSITHQIKSDKITASHYKIQLARLDEIPNRDFVLEYKIAGEQPEAVVMQSSDQQGEGYFLMMAAPPSDFKIKDIVAREMIFIVDTSGSMNGLKMEQAKNAMRACLRGLNPQDDFNIIRFSNDFQAMWQKSQSVNQLNINSADQFVNNLRAVGGTEMYAPLMHALQHNPAMAGQPVKPRTIVFITDGQVGNEAQILEAVKQNLGQTKIFTFGIDSAVNEYFLRKLAEIGQGTSEFILPAQQDFETVINRFQSRISAPMLSNVAIDWGQMQVSDFYPNPIPDLYINQPLFITGKFKSIGTREQVFVKALSAVGLSSLPVVIDTSVSNIRFRALSSLWARAKVEELSNKLIETPNSPAAKQEIIDLGLKHKLLTQFTSFVALEEKTIVPKEGGKPQTIKVPVPLPENWNGNNADDAILRDEEEKRGKMEILKRKADKITSQSAPNYYRMTTPERKAAPSISTQNVDTSGLGSSPGAVSAKGAREESGRALGTMTSTDSRPGVAISRHSTPVPSSAPPPPPEPERSAKVGNMSANVKAPVSDKAGSRGDRSNTPADTKGKEKDRTFSNEANSVKEPKVVNKSEVKSEAIDLADSRSLDEVERYLARSQAINGAWADMEQNAIRTTAITTLAFVLNGNTARKGNYQPQLRRAIELLNSSVDSNGVLSDKGSVVSTDTLAITLWAMSEIVSDSPSVSNKQTAERLLVSLLKRRSSNGLWLAKEGASESISATSWAIIALESAKKAGLNVEQSIIDEANRAFAKDGKNKLSLNVLIKELNLTSSQPVANAAIRYLILSNPTNP
ncbi:MAG: VWA domain-containing protein [Acidobacteria bacterium]|nr:VWA domain-containing protein [Acidobacteriota bacterium]